MATFPKSVTHLPLAPNHAFSWHFDFLTGVQPAAQDGYEGSPTQNHKFT